MKLLFARELSKRFGNKPVVSDVSIRVDASEVVGLLGPNGAGKTTTFKMLMGLIRPDSGTVTFCDEDVTHAPVARRARAGLGYLAQDPSVFRKLKVRENVMAVIEWIPGLSKGERVDRLDQSLKEMNLTHLADNSAGVLSGGERRRLEIARILVTQPKLLLLDEPFSGVDPIAVEEIQKIVRHLKKRGIGILITDHNVRETLAITDRSYIVHEGRILQQGAAPQLIADEQVRRAYLGESFVMPELDKQGATDSDDTP